ncbi:DNA topoisomerase [Sphingosinicella sp. BN140058]|uniref:DNA topoisomerase n=1 Tax=Sphingosinicella sp. BN140058 TaxID=1892855 RepID=UPI001012E4A3|nr:DNA topoisomerase [Sphingosinicella sp. BN140058]QAY80208.1 DNA topoisomerase III [Sphingosinicella sp. BN140058]
MHLFSLTRSRSASANQDIFPRGFLKNALPPSDPDARLSCMRLWIAEKAAAARDIAKALGGGQENGGMIRLSSNEVVTWAIGHLLESYMPHDYDEAYRKWDLAQLPILPAKFLNKPDPDKRRQLGVVTGLIQKASEIVIATDAGREGEAIAWSVLDHAGWRGPCKRLWTSALNQSHLKKAVLQLIDDREKFPLYISARIRSSMDWSDGVNWSRYYNLRILEPSDRVLSLGRVQTATLALVVDRDNEIARFVPSAFYELKAIMDLPEGRLELLHQPAAEKRITDRAAAQDIVRRTQGVPTNLKVEHKPKSFAPPPPYSLPDLQIAASARWGWSPKQTLDVLQSLYEKGAVTYPRTDAGHLNNEMEVDMPHHLAALRQRPQFRQLADINPPVIRKSVFDSSKVEDHHGIIPTNECIDIQGLGPDAEKLFDIIARRFIACLMPDAKGSTTSISATIDGVVFRTAGTTITDLGWKVVWGGKDEPADKADDDQDEDEVAAETNRILPPVYDGEPAVANPVQILNKMTKPPVHFTQGTLLAAMKSAGKKSDDAEVRELLSGGGLGTQATRQDILEKLRYRKFCELKGKKFLSTQRAREFIGILREDGNRLADIIATADLERELRLVEKDPRQALPIWERYKAQLAGEINKLKAGPAPRKLTPIGDGRRSNGAASGGPRGGSPRSGPSSGRRAPSGGNGGRKGSYGASRSPQPSR